jgi:hypothetical protein
MANAFRSLQDKQAKLMKIKLGYRKRFKRIIQNRVLLIGLLGIASGRRMKNWSQNLRVKVEKKIHN